MPDAALIPLTVNGETVAVPAGSTVRDVLTRLGIDCARVAVEHNRAVVPRDEHTTRTLAAGDELEIVTFVGGGCESCPRGIGDSLTA